MNSFSNTIQEKNLWDQLFQESEAKWRAITEHSPHHIMILDPSGTILFINHAVPGFSIDQLIGSSIFELLTETDAEAAHVVFERVLGSGKPDKYELSCKHEGETTKVYETFVYPLKDNGEVIAVITESRDISEQRRQQDELRQQHTLLNTVISNAPIIIWAFDQHGTITLVQGKGLQALGVHDHEAIGQSIFDVFRDYPQIMLDAEQALGGKKFSSITYVSGRVYKTHYNPLLDQHANVISVIGVATDITDLKETESQMQILSSALEQTADLVMITDKDGLIEYVNPAFETITGYLRDEVLHRKPKFLRSNKHDKAFYQNLWNTLLQGETFSDVFINQRKDGSIYYEEKTITPIRDHSNTITHFVATGKDISERMRTHERLEYMAHHDALTKLPNRTLFLDRLAQAIARAQWHNRLVAVMFMDLDRFKDINDSQGHGIGDQLLMQLTQRLGESVRTGDTVARFGGDEFAILLDDIASEKDVSALAKKILDTLAPTFLIEGREFYVTASIGVSMFPTDGEDNDTLLRNADVAMYRAKDMGRNNYQFYSNDMSARAFERLTLENSLRHAVKRQEFFLLYQPQYDTRNNKLVGVEALLRWQHPDLGIIAPTEFIPLLEETGLVVQVGEWVLSSACAQLQQWHAAGYKDLVMSVNLSGRQFNDVNFLLHIQKTIEHNNINPDRLELEITESMLMRNASKTISALNTLNHLGVSIAVDDFGTGYSSLNYLRRFPISTLKIDRSFIRDVAEDKDDEAIATAIIVMAQSLNLNVIAEGVEDDQQLAMLQSRNCYLIQGNWYSAAVSASSISKMLSAQNAGTK